MSQWLFNIYMDGVMREVKGKVWEVGVKLYNEGRKWEERREWRGDFKRLSN